MIWHFCFSLNAAFFSTPQWRKFEPGVPTECVVDNPESVLRFNWAFLGRTWLFWLNELDNWQKHYTIIGAGGTGKSVIMTVLKKIFKSEDVAVAASSMETTFGLANLYNSYVWTISEMTNTFKMDYADWLSIVVGEDVQIRQKYKDAFPFSWKSGGISIGNVPAAWADKRGAYSRRLIYNMFEHTVRSGHKDGEMEKKCSLELPRIIVKMTRAYLSLIKWMAEKRQTDIEQVWPTMYRHNIAKFQGSNDMLESFIKSGNLRIGGDLYVPQPVFIKHFRDYCVASGQPSQRFTAWNPHTYEQAFSRSKIVHGLGTEELQ